MEFLSCPNKNCNLIIRMVNNEITKETNHPWNYDGWNWMLKNDLKMKVDVCKDLKFKI